MPLRSRSDRTLVAVLFYASLLAEVAAWAAFGLMIVILAVALNPSLARGAPVEDRWPLPGEIATPSTFEAANFLNAWAAADDPLPIRPRSIDRKTEVPSPMRGAHADATTRCARSHGGGTTHWMWREIDGAKCWYVGTMLVSKSRLRW